MLSGAVNPDTTIGYSARLVGKILVQNNIRMVVLNIGILYPIKIVLRPLPYRTSLKEAVEAEELPPMSYKINSDLILDLENGKLGNLQVGQIIDREIVKNSLKQEPDLIDYGQFYYHKGVDLGNTTDTYALEEGRKVKLKYIDVHMKKKYLGGDFLSNRFDGIVIPQLDEVETIETIKQKFGQPTEQEERWLVYNKSYGRLIFQFDEGDKLSKVGLDTK